MANADVKAVLVKHLGREFLDSISGFAQQRSLRQLSQFSPDNLNAAKLQALERELEKVPIPH